MLGQVFDNVYIESLKTLYLHTLKLDTMKLNPHSSIILVEI